MEERNVAEELKNVLAPIGLPVSHVSYNGKEDSYIVFNFSTIPEFHADDMPQYERYLIQIHLFMPLKRSGTQIEKQVKQALAKAGYTWPTRTDASDDRRSSYGNTRHIVFETETEEGVEWRDS